MSKSCRWCASGSAGLPGLSGTGAASASTGPAPERPATTFPRPTLSGTWRCHEPARAQPNSLPRTGAGSATELDDGPRLLLHAMPIGCALVVIRGASYVSAATLCTRAHAEGWRGSAGRWGQPGCLGSSRRGESWVGERRDRTSHRNSDRNCVLQSIAKKPFLPLR